MLLFVSHYPDEDSIKDGMSQRISNIDSYFNKDKRTYIDISIRRFPKLRYKEIDNLTVIECNLFLHFFLIFKQFNKADKIYFHSVLKVLNALIFILLLNKKMILDIHGVVPEELKMNNKILQFYIYKFCEKIIFGKAKLLICVSENMKNFYVKNYPRSHAKYVTYPILPNTIDNINKTENYSKEYSTVNFVYSGNTQKWQNVELMIDVISKNLKDNFIYYILTRNVDEMKALFEEKIGLSANNQIVILSVNPENLKEYYEKCHYGFILRDDVLVNNVACPTKMVEYLHYGIIPIVKSTNIGDFESMNYDYIDYKDSYANLLPVKSEKNIAIVKKLLDHNKELNLRDLVLNL